MSTPFLGEIKIVSFGYPPKGWEFCNGQLLPINENQALFSILGTTYGGNGTTNFALPNLQGRVPVHPGSGIVLGASAGEQSVTLESTQIPFHTHIPAAVSNNATLTSPTNNLWASSPANPFGNGSASVALNPAAVTQVGGSQAHNNLPPYLVLQFVIALVGIFPSQN
jgi:microcystin-dependent protein